MLNSSLQPLSTSGDFHGAPSRSPQACGCVWGKPWHVTPLLQTAEKLPILRDLVPPIFWDEGKKEGRKGEVVCHLGHEREKAFWWAALPAAPPLHWAACRFRQQRQLGTANKH